MGGSTCFRAVWKYALRGIRVLQNACACDISFQDAVLRFLF